MESLKEFANSVRIAQAAKMTGISAPKLRRLARAGLIGYVQKGGQMHFRQSDLEEYARQCAVPALKATN